MQYDEKPMTAFEILIVIAAVFVLLLAAPRPADAQPKVVRITGGIRGPANEVLSANGEITFQLSAPITVSDDTAANTEWVISSQPRTMTLTDPASVVLDMHPNMSGGGFTVSPESTYYTVTVRTETGSFQQLWQITCCTAAEAADVVIAAETTAVANHLEPTEILAGIGIDVGVEGTSVRITNTNYNGFDTQNVGATGNATLTVTIGYTMGDATYSVLATPHTDMGSGRYYIDNRTTTAFDIGIYGVNGGLDYSFSWMVEDY